MGSQIYTTFFCRHNEPSYIKQIKLEILTCIADENNAYDIVTELTEYVSDIDERLARDAVRAVGRIALEVCLPFYSFFSSPPPRLLFFLFFSFFLEGGVWDLEIELLGFVCEGH